jgi:hypothetical protein
MSNCETASFLYILITNQELALIQESGTFDELRLQEARGMLEIIARYACTMICNLSSVNPHPSDKIKNSHHRSQAGWLFFLM